MTTTISAYLDRCLDCGGELSYVEGGQTLYRTIGIELRGVYDGVALWTCPHCGVVWHRFDEGSGYRARVDRYLAAQSAELRPRVLAVPPPDGWCCWSCARLAAAELDGRPTPHHPISAGQRLGRPTELHDGEAPR